MIEFLVVCNKETSFKHLPNSHWHVLLMHAAWKTIIIIIIIIINKFIYNPTELDSHTQ